MVLVIVITCRLLATAVLVVVHRHQVVLLQLLVQAQQVKVLLAEQHLLELVAVVAVVLVQLVPMVHLILVQMVAQV
jgi:hypothetical protein